MRSLKAVKRRIFASIRLRAWVPARHVRNALPWCQVARRVSTPPGKTLRCCATATCCRLAVAERGRTAPCSRQGIGSGGGLAAVAAPRQCGGLGPASVQRSEGGARRAARRALHARTQAGNHEDCRCRIGPCGPVERRALGHRGQGMLGLPLLLGADGHSLVRIS